MKGDNRAPKVFVVGDSTLSAFSDNYYLPRYGYGTQLGRYLAGAEVVNLALSGRSSKSFLSEPEYAELKAGLRPGDFLVIGFGHNDEKKEPERYTNPNPPYTQRGEGRGTGFAACLYDNYVCVARERGAIPILCTPIVRLSPEDDYSGVCGHITPSGGGYDGGDYAAAVRRLGRDAGVEVVDLTSATMAAYLREGHERASRRHAWAGTLHGVPVGLDGTHLNKFGAALVAYEWACAVAAGGGPLAAYIASPLVPPDEDEYKEAVNAAYREPEYLPFTEERARSLTFGPFPPWYAAVMGAFGGSEHLREFSLSAEGEDIVISNMSVVPRGGIGGEDGFAAAFMPLPADVNFTASAECEVLAVGDGFDGRSAFGLMLRDDIYCDEFVPGLNSNFVAAGYAGGNSLFAREGGSFKGLAAAPFVGVGGRVKVGIERVNQQLRLECDGRTLSLFDFDLAAVDGGKDYLCLFAARHVSVRFSHINFTVTGRSSRA